MSCPEMKTGEILKTNVNFSRFETLEKFPKLMLNNLFETTWKLRELPPGQHFSAFLQAWELLACTAEITTGLLNDEDWYKAIRVDNTWADRFNFVMQNPKSLMRMYSKRFVDSWPIFDAAELERRGLLDHNSELHGAMISSYWEMGVHEYLPECWLRHQGEGITQLPDWEHTLSAWFAVRCNFFKDPLWINSENNEKTVSNAFLSLIYFFKESKLYFENPSLKPDIFDRTQVLSSL